MDLSPQEARFTDQCGEFYDKARARYRTCAMSIEELLELPTEPLAPILVDRLEEVGSEAARSIESALTTGFGVAYVVPVSASVASARHPLHQFVHQVKETIDLGYPVDHPMEGHPEACSRFGDPDGTLKIYHLPVEPMGPRYREQAETNEMFDSHNDGLGFAGLISKVIFSLDSPPLTGGFTYFQNLVRAAPAIAASDEEAYRSLFLPDAIIAIRPRGKGAIKVTAPVFYLGPTGEPQTFFRITTGEYRMIWRDLDALDRARRLLERICTPFGPGSRFVHLVQPGETVVVDNFHVVHGRTPFVDGSTGPGRVLARKWFVESEVNAPYRHVPSVCVDARWAALFPDQFSEERLRGEWHFDQVSGDNVRIS